uniref:Putative ribonuclease H-like domain-containing protein n=1 Tax=Tanacetum cinerariifolium TaxID=118510 RepID=A0A6L2MAD7_TANCI|nr:putative ribonuclease H-like domain-containing protein [Tanacetum cinerariifolium]
MSAKDKSELGNRTQIHEGVLSYENEVLESVFNNRPSDTEDSLVNNRFSKVKGMHAVPPLMTGNYMPPKSNFRIDESKFSYGPKQSKNSKSDAKISDFASCDSNSSLETLKSVPKQVKSKPKAVSKPKVWSDAPIIEEYESNSDDENVSTATVEQEIHSCASINTVQHVKSPRCSRHMTGNKAYLVEYQDFNGGPVAFGGSKGQITDTECLVLSPDFKLPDENQVLLRVLRQHNMYSFNLKHIVPSRGPKEANNNVGTQDNLNAGNSKTEAEHVTKYFVLPLWSSYTSTVKCSKAKNGDEKLNEDTGSKTNKEPVDQKGQAFLEELEKLKRQEKEANDAAASLRKSFAQSTKDLLLQAGTAKASSTSYVNTACTPFNTASLSRNGHRKEEGIDYDEVFALVARLEAIKIFLAFAFYMGLIVYQIDVKRAFLYGKIDEEVYVSQPLGFIDPKFRKKVYKVVKALYGLHQAPRDWYATLFTFLVESRYKRGIIDKTLFIKKDQKDIMLVFGILKSQPLTWKPTQIVTMLEQTLIGNPQQEVLNFLVRDLFHGSAKKQTIIATSTTEAEHYFIRDTYQKKLIQALKIHTDDNVADLLTKAFDVSSDFNKLDDLVGEGANYAVNDGRSTDKIKVLNAEAKGVSAAGETLSTATLAVSTVSVQPILLCSFENQEAKMGKELASTKQTAFGKDFLNPLMANSLPKTIWLSMHHVIAMRHWLFQSERSILTDLKVTLTKHGRMIKPYSSLDLLLTVLLQIHLKKDKEIIYKWVSDEELEIPKMEPYVEAALQAPPPSSDYVSRPEHPPPSPYYIPGPEELRAPLPPDFILEPEYLEYLVPFDAKASIKEQPYATDASPMTLSLGYIVDSNLEEDEDEEDPDEDPTDYPADRGDDDDDDESSNDDDDDNNEEDEEEEEEEHPAPADSTAITFPADHASSAKETVPFETDESVATLRPPPPTYHVKARMSI